MKDNKKIYTRDLYYATKLDEKGNTDYVIGIMKNGVFIDIVTDEKYIRNGREGFFEPLKDSKPIKLFGFEPYWLIDKKSMYNIKTVGEILDKDKKLTKTFVEEIGEYIFDDPESVQETLAIIKPDGIKNATKIIEMIYNSGLKIKKYEVRMLDEDILKEHYAHIVDRPFYPELENYMLSGEVVLMILEGVNAVQKFRNLMGPTDSEKAPIGTIRGEFGTNKTYNAVHGSDSTYSAFKEIERFFRQKQKRI